MVEIVTEAIVRSSGLVTLTIGMNGLATENAKYGEDQVQIHSLMMSMV
jgi:hypothetical protein